MLDVELEFLIILASRRLRPGDVRAPAVPHRRVLAVEGLEEAALMMIVPTGLGGAVS